MAINLLTIEVIKMKQRIKLIADKKNCKSENINSANRAWNIKNEK